MFYERKKAHGYYHAGTSLGILRVSTIYFPVIRREDGSVPSSPPTAPNMVNARGFGVGARMQSDAPDAATTLRLLKPPVWYNWWWYARGEREGTRAPDPNWYPMIWNPNHSSLYCWPDETVAALPDTWWLIGNEPVNPQQRHIIVYPPELMANQARAFEYQTGRRYILCGEYLDEAGIAYCRELDRLGVNQVARAWHIYPNSPDEWLTTLYKAFDFDPNRPVFITETALWNQPASNQRKLMDKVIWALDKYPQLHCVMWYDNYDAGDPTVSLLTAPGPNCQPTEIGKHYIDVTR